MTLTELILFQEYCYNEMNYDKFKEAYADSKFDDAYLFTIFKNFNKNNILFITSRHDQELFNYIVEQIQPTNYKG